MQSYVSYYITSIFVSKYNIIYRILVLAKCDTIVEVRENKKKGEKVERK